MRKELRDLFVTAHRAECEAAHDGNQTTGIFRDIRGEEEFPVTEEGMFIYNLGVGAGVQGMLSQLSEEGYSIVTPTGVLLENKKEDDQPQDFGKAFSQWLINPDPVQDRPTGNGGGYQGNTGTSGAFERNKLRNFAASSRLDGISMPDPDGGPVDEEEPMD